MIEEPLPDGRVQKHIYDAQSGGYKPYGAPYQPYAPRKGAGAYTTASIVDSILGADPTAQNPTVPTAATQNPAGLAAADTGGLQSYAPKAGAALLTAGAGSVAKGASSTPGTDANLQAALAAVARGANPQAVRQRLASAGYPESVLRAAGL